MIGRALLTVLILAAPVAAQRVLPRSDPERPEAPAAETDRSGARAERRRQDLVEYRRRSAAIPQEDAAAHFRLAAWCDKVGLRRQMRRELVCVVALEPDHLPARRLLGQRKVDGVWLPRAEALRREGYRLIQGRWLTPAGIAALRRRVEERAAAAKRLEERVNTLIRRMAGPSDRDARKARDELVQVARKRKLARLEQLARRLYPVYRGWWREVRMGLITVRAQHARLTGLERRNLSLGTGTPVTLELPRTRSVSIGTTVGVPVGR